MTYASSIEIPGAPQTILEEVEQDEIVPVLSHFGAHHLLWLNCLQQVEDGSIKRLMGLMPPGAGKSVYTSVVFPTHFLGRFKNTEVIVASYGTVLPRKFGRRARSIVQQPIFRRFFDCTLSEESAAVDEWSLTNGSGWMAKGILTGITGNRMDGVVWDDLIKGREQADSEPIRQKTWDAYVDDLMTRKKPMAWEVGITTRWHEDDPAGRILPANYDGESGWIKCKDGNDWFVICLQAVCERADDPLGRKIGEVLWPEWFTPEHFAPFKRVARTWNALFQQRPAPESGDYFQADWLKPYTTTKSFAQENCPLLPDLETLNIYGASDYAVSDGKGDYTVHAVVGIDGWDRMWLLDLWREQTSSDKWVESFCDLVQRWRPLGWAEETGQIKSGVGPFLEKRLRERQLYIARALFPTKGDKSVRAQSIRGRMAMNGLYVPTDAPWFPALKKELMSFPAGNNDDQVDALGLIGQVLDKMVTGRSMPEDRPKAKLLSTNPSLCTVTLEDLFEANERYQHNPTLRIH